MKYNYFNAILISCCLILFCSHSVFAITLQQAKQQGLVGEAKNGFIAAVKPSNNTAVTHLINTVNKHRKETFQTISQSHDLPLNIIKQRAYHKAIEKTQVGNFYQNNQGSWQKKQP
ncbi:YdbL family protein [Photobacterium iliopiscarium]|nr:YdbL family protein [Photobacterium iliopiscarium]